MGGGIGPAPETRPEAAAYLTAFWTLVYDRPIGFGGVGGIPFTAIACYADMAGITGDAFWVFERAIRLCDVEYLSWANTKDGKRQTVSSDPMTPAQFDAMFG